MNTSLAFDQLKAVVNLALARSCVPADDMRMTSVMESAIGVALASCERSLPWCDYCESTDHETDACPYPDHDAYDEAQDAYAGHDNGVVRTIRTVSE